MDIKAELKFPILSLDFLRKYTCRTYQIKQSQGYAKQHLYDNEQEFTLELSRSVDDLLRCWLHSRHSNNTKYFLCVRFANNDEKELIKDHYCQCKSGPGMVGCCGHVATVLWYRGYARHIKWQPSAPTDEFKKKIIQP